MNYIDLGQGDRAFWDSYWERWYPRQSTVSGTTTQPIQAQPQPVIQLTEQQLRAIVAEEVAKALHGEEKKEQ